MKTIFIPISARQQARNVLRTDILKTLQAEPNVRIVVFASPAQTNHYREECPAAGTFFEEVKISREPLSRLDAFFHRLSLFYINSGTARFLRKQWLFYERGQPFRYIVSVGALFVLGSSHLLQAILRFLDLHSVRDERLARFFNTYKPDLVFTPKITSSLDRSFLRHAKKRGVKTVGMISTWDNITLAKYPFRILPDKLVAQNEIIKKDAVRYLHLPPASIFVSGMPHFDFYVTTKRASREEFCARLGIDQGCRIILFASVGKVANPTEWQTLSLLARAHEAGKLPRGSVIIFRQHPTEKTEIENIPRGGHVIVDDSKTVLSGGGEMFSEILSKDMEHLADSVYHASLLVTTTSTMSIDASVFDTPVINIAFDGWEKRPLHSSVRRKFTRYHTHYQPIVKSGGVRIAHSIDELISAIRLYLENPALERGERKRIIREQCYRLDGKSGRRIAEFILVTVKNKQR